MTDRHLKYLEYLDVGTLPEHYQDVAAAIGKEAMVKLAEAFPCVPIYLKRPDKILRKAKEAYILSNFTGANHRRLALDTSLALFTVYEILNKAREEKQGWKQETLI